MDDILPNFYIEFSDLKYLYNAYKTQPYAHRLRTIPLRICRSGKDVCKGHEPSSLSLLGIVCRACVWKKIRRMLFYPNAVRRFWKAMLLIYL